MKLKKVLKFIRSEVSGSDISESDIIGIGQTYMHFIEPSNKNELKHICLLDMIRTVKNRAKDKSKTETLKDDIKTAGERIVKEFGNSVPPGYKGMMQFRTGSGKTFNFPFGGSFPLVSEMSKDKVEARFEATKKAADILTEQLKDFVIDYTSVGGGNAKFSIKAYNEDDARGQFKRLTPADQWKTINSIKELTAEPLKTEATASEKLGEDLKGEVLYKTRDSRTKEALLLERDNKREPGFYFVRIGDESNREDYVTMWVVAEWTTDKTWYLTSYVRRRISQDFAEINETRIATPTERKEREEKLLKSLQDTNLILMDRIIPFLYTALPDVKDSVFNHIKNTLKEFLKENNIISA